jgi:hypothetical protein
MLFDLKGRRRRVVQATYLTLAVLMGGGLVFFGIGSDVSGGLFDAFKDESGGNGNSVIEERVQSAERRLAANPRDEAALKAVVRGRYQIAGQSADPNTFKYTAEGKAELAKAARAWERYLALEPEKPDVALARYMVQAYSAEALNRAEEGAEAAEIVAGADPSAQNYLALARYAQEAGQERKADLAGDQALELAKGKEKKAVKAQLKQIKQAGQAGGAAPPAGGAAPQPQG